MRTHIAKRYSGHTYSAPVTVGNVVRVCVCDGGTLRVAICAPAGLSSSMRMTCGWFTSCASGCAAECWSVSAGAAVARRERGEGYASTTLPPTPLPPPNIKSNRSVWQWSKGRRQEYGEEAVIGGVPSQPTPHLLFIYVYANTHKTHTHTHTHMYMYMYI